MYKSLELVGWLPSKEEENLVMGTPFHRNPVIVKGETFVNPNQLCLKYSLKGPAMCLKNTLPPVRMNHHFFLCE